jgi:hypothetical protein
MAMNMAHRYGVADVVSYTVSHLQYTNVVLNKGWQEVYWRKQQCKRIGIYTVNYRRIDNHDAGNNEQKGCEDAEKNMPSDTYSN